MPLIDQDVPGPRRDFIGHGRHTPKVVWPNDAKLALNIVVNHEEGSEYSIPAGDQRNEGLAEIPYQMPAEYRDLAAESVYEYGARAGVWRLIRMFDEYELNVTWYAAAVALERNPEAAQWVRENDRVDICSHGWRWTMSSPSTRSWRWGQRSCCPVTASQSWAPKRSAPSWRSTGTLFSMSTTPPCAA